MNTIVQIWINGLGHIVVIYLLWRNIFFSNQKSFVRLIHKHGHAKLTKFHGITYERYTMAMWEIRLFWALVTFGLSFTIPSIWSLF